MKYSQSIVLLFLTGLLGLMVIGCQQDSPVSIQSNPMVAQGPDFVKMPKPAAGEPLLKLITDLQTITPEQGGQLKLAFQYKYVATSGRKQLFQVKLTLTFPPHAVGDTVLAGMTIDDQELRSNVDILFNPHGTSFLKPAILDCDVKGMEVEDYDPNDELWLYYDENGTWVKMKAKKVEFNYDQGQLMCRKGELPHFSRYAFGR